MLAKSTSSLVSVQLAQQYYSFVHLAKKNKYLIQIP